MSLRVCPSCSRHVRETSCPFCGAELSLEPPVSIPRAARIVLLCAVATAAVATACSSAHPLDGAPMPAASANDAAQSDAGNDAMATFYGGPPVDSGGAGDSGTD